jgi:Zn-dependent M16 (insulinase) family peptidase
MTTLHGFELLRERELPEAGSTARLYRHAPTGAELLSLINDDENKVFGVSFRTPPSDSTGVAHILEHSVLCGSRKYPVKEPFVELIKGSLNTFLNAFTYPDKTCYPVASQNLQDFYNLIDVYLDAVFHPLLAPHTFAQEGWHYELDAVDAPIVYKGVVFNEMKGAYSSPEAILGRWSQQSLFPDTTYGVDSGGDPKHIPDLTYAGLKSFHARYYHPSNARLFFHGDDDPTERLRLLDAWLSAFERIAVDSAVALQPRFAEPRRSELTFVAPEDERAARKSMVTVNWMFGEVADVETALALAILDHILIGTPASPLRKALIDSGLGEAPVGHGLDDDLRQPAFSIGLKGVEAADVEKVEPLVLDVLRGLAAHGIDRLTVDASLNTTEFRLRENNTGSFPRGIALMLRALKTWLYDRDPIAPLAFADPLAAIKARLAAGERTFEDLIGRNFLDNRHRTTVLLRPDPSEAAREAAEERGQLDAGRASMTAADLEAAVADTRTLKRLQETPDPPEALATIPSLTLADLPRREKQIPLEEGRTQDTAVLYHDLATAGIVYLDLAFDLHRLPAALLPFVGLFARALLETGAGGEDFVALSQRIGRSTGGIATRKWTSATRGSATGSARLLLRAKAMPEKTGELLAILRDVLLAARLDNRERIQQLVVEERASQEAQLTQRGVSYVDLRLRANLHEAGWAAEQMEGISGLRFMRALADRLESDWDSVRGDLEHMRTILIDRAAMVVNVTTDAGNWRRFEPELAAFLATLPLSGVAAPAAWTVGQGPRFEGLTVPAKVNYVGKGGDLYRLGYRENGAALVITNHVSSTWLWDKIRVQGGAYGGRLLFDRLSGGVRFLSWRDPNLLATLDVYDRTGEYLRGASLGESEVTRGVIGTIGDLDQHQLPDAKGLASMLRRLSGDSDESRQRMREEVLSTKAADFRRFAEVLAEVASQGQVTVLGSATAIEAANRERPGFLQVSQLL